MTDGYPRPQLARSCWTNLNGSWRFRFDDTNIGEREKWFCDPLPGEQAINVPFTYETALSGIGDERFHPVVWYERTISCSGEGSRTLLHFEGSDHETKVWINGSFAGGHRGGYSRFSFDITDYLKSGENRLTVRVEDSMSCVQPRGKQRWKKENFGCWYVQTTGIWKTVWLEEVPQNYIESVKITPDITNASVSFAAAVNRRTPEPLHLRCTVTLAGEPVAEETVLVRGTQVQWDMRVTDSATPWQMALWTPEHPNLYDVKLELLWPGGSDTVGSYFGMREISIENGKVLLNHLPFYQRLILDQGYWKESGLTPPSEDALVKDIDLILAAGYNGLRKHEKIEDERFLYWCDKKGLVVWCEMPSQYAFSDEAIERYAEEWMEIVRQNYNHPCIVTWTAFNESWGIERIYGDKQIQRFTEAIYHLTKAFDGMRPVIVNDGWEHTVSDILTLHDYEETGEVFSERYRDKDAIIENRKPFNRDRYAFARGYSYKGQPIIISEYGGIAFCGGEGWGYGNGVNSEAEFLHRFKNITDAIRELPYCVGYCYTQVTDVQQEINGLFTMAREPKVNIDEVRRINMNEK